MGHIGLVAQKKSIRVIVLISIIISTYNRPDALALVLKALALQDCSSFETIVADDGSTKETSDTLHHLQRQMPYPISHVWHEDEGFRLAAIRNKAAARAKGDYLVFLDGDCIPLKSFVRRHIKLAKCQWFVSGNRILLNESFTKQVLQQQTNLSDLHLKSWLAKYFNKECNRWWPLLPLPLGCLRRLWAHRWQKARGCNLAMWKNDFVAVNGFDESYTGWGYEDSDLALRLIRNNIKCKSGNFAVPVIHLWHKNVDKAAANANLAKLQILQRDTENVMRAKKGVDQYL